jgi:virginiamycin B lyase
VNSKQRLLITICLLAGALVLCMTQVLLKPTSVEAKVLADTGTVSGRVEAPKPFKAAQVYVRNVDKNILYMVYTSGGRYRAVNLFPGNYEVSVRKSGFESDTKKVAVKLGERTTADFTLHEGKMESVKQGAYGLHDDLDVQLVSYDELYPPGPGRELVQPCIVCHGRNFLPSHQWTTGQWNSALDLMMSPEFPGGPEIMPGNISQQDREKEVDYLTRNFGPNGPKKGLKVAVEMPLDEQVLAKAMYVEYYLPLDPQLDAKNKKRLAQDPHFDNEGNVWYTDRSIPNRVGRLNPRTGEIKDYLLPDPKADPHGLTVDAGGHVWWSEVLGFHLGRLDPKTGEMTRYPIPPDSTGKNKYHGLSPVVDSKQNIWFSLIVGNRIGKWDRKTQKVTLWEVPTPNSYPYGILVDKNDKIWTAEFHGCKVAKFDPETQKWTEYAALEQPCTIRRLGVDSKGTIWYGVFSSGKLGKLDPSSGKIVEYSLPVPFSEPYDVWPDAEDNIWIGDGGQGGALVKFNPRTQQFTYYPAPQRTDMPKLDITRDGAIWYCTRSGSRTAVGVLHPDVAKMTSPAAYR